MSINIGGFQPLTTIDYPNNLSCVVFTQGCPWRCRYCHNHELIPSNKETEFDWGHIFDFLKTRVGLLDAVVFSGGEPCLQKNLLSAILQVKSLGFKIGLHTAGCYPDRLQACIKHLDWVGFDIKQLPLNYEQVTQTPKSADKAWLSLNILLESKVDYQLRITQHPDLINDKQLSQLKRLIKTQYGAKLMVQKCNTQNCLDRELSAL